MTSNKQPTAAEKNPGEGVPKETPQRNSLKALEHAAQAIVSPPEAKKLAAELVRSGYYEASLMEQFRMAADALFRVCPASKRRKLIDSLLSHDSERIRAYAGPVAFAAYSDDIAVCADQLYRVGIAVGTSPQEIAQMYLKRLMQLHGFAKVVKHCGTWVKDPNAAARRLLIEAARPRGVWTGHLVELRKDPAPLKPLLEAVLDDPSDYVRKAAANCINDIAKDHPDAVCAWVREWTRKPLSSEREFIIKRGLRALLKAAHPEALKLSGFGDAQVLTTTWTNALPAAMTPGNYIEVVLEIANPTGKAIAARAQAELHGPGAGGRPRLTKYQLGEITVPPRGSANLSKRIRFVHRNTQPKLKGLYKVAVTLNGHPVSTQSFTYK